MQLGLFEVRYINFAIELYSLVLCIVGVICLAIMLPRDAENRRFIFPANVCAILMCAGDAAAALGRGQVGLAAWLAVHVGNFFALAAPQVMLALYAAHLCRTLGREEGRFVWWHRSVWAIAALAIVFIAAGGAYSIDAQNVYSRRPGFGVVVATVFYMSIVNLILLTRFRGDMKSRTYFAYASFSVLPLAASVAQVFAYGLNIPVIAYMLCLMALYFDSLLTATEKAADARERVALQEKELAEARLAAVVSQIRPHFLFNTLDGIYMLCAEDPDRARKAIDEFATYLRSNLDSLGQKAPVPIESEISHVRTYLELEKMSMEDLLDYEIDLQAGGFRVPVLSVQTIAENAVKHGVGKKPGGGKVVVRTREALDCFLVSVHDDGVGFEVDEVGGDGHLGIENTRTRLAVMCGGELKLTSTPGEGTYAVMRIPKRDGKERP